MDRTTSATIDATGPLQIRSHRRAAWFWLDKALIDTHAQAIGVIALGLYVALARYANDKTGQCWPSLVRLSRQLGITHLTARRHLQRLVDRGLIVVESRPGSTALITLLDMSGQEEAGAFSGNEVAAEDSYATGEETGGARHDVTRGSLPDNDKRTFPNEQKEKGTHPDVRVATDEEQTSTADTRAIPVNTDQPAITPPRPHALFPSLEILPLATQERLTEAARESLIGEGVAPWFLIRPVIEARMMALWCTQGPEGLVEAYGDARQDETHESASWAAAVA